MLRSRPSLRAIAALALFAGAGRLAGACTPSEPPPVDEPVTPSAPIIAQQQPMADDDPVRIKGLAPRLVLYRQRDGKIEELRDGDDARAGDLVQLSYMAAGNRNGVVLSLDGRGLVTLHHPARVDAPTALVERGQHALDHAYQLDDAQAFERFVFVTAGDEALPPAAVIAAARHLAQTGPAARHSRLALPERWQQSSIVIDKRP